MKSKADILSHITRNNTSWIEQNDYDIENSEEIRANNFIVLRIKEYMKVRGLKQNELAALLNVTPQYVNKLFHGQVRNIGIGTLLKYGDKLGIKLVEIPGLTKVEYNEKIVEANIKYIIHRYSDSYLTSHSTLNSIQNYSKNRYGYKKVS